MRDYAELVERLREAARFSESRGYSGMANTTEDAADAIEELQKLLDAVNDAHNEGFDVGYWAGRRDYEPKWIPVTERLPEAMPGNYSLDVLVTDGEDIAICQYFNGDGLVSMWGYSGIGEITHWMPLEEPPKEEKAK